MEEERAYTKRDLRRAVNASAILGWFVISAPFVSEIGISLLPLAALIGLPIAFISCWVIAAPILWRVMREQVSWLFAMLWGAVISATMATVSIVAGRLNGLAISRDPNRSFQLGGGEYIKEVDGILTSYGWWILFQQTMLFILAGAIIGLIMRTIIGSGVKRNKE